MRNRVSVVGNRVFQFITLGMVPALVAACGAATPPLPSHGGPAWHELQTEHLTLWTDAPLVDARTLMTSLELRRQVVVHAMNDAPATMRAFVIALDSDRELRQYLPDNALAFAVEPEGAALLPTVVLPAHVRETQLAVTHELAHVISWSLIANQPRWLGEGLAMYFENIDFSRNPAKVSIGYPRDEIARLLVRDETWHLPALLACTGARCTEASFYATSWALVSYLVNMHTEAFAHYLYELDHSRPGVCERQACTEACAARWGVAWCTAFGRFSLDELEAELHAWLRNGRVRFPEIDVNVRPMQASERLLSDADVLAARATLASFARGRAAAQALAAQSLALDATQVLGNVVGAHARGSIAPDVARAVVAEHPDDWRAHWLLAYALKDDPAGASALAQLCRFEPKLRTCRAAGSK